MSPVCYYETSIEDHLLGLIRNIWSRHSREGGNLARRAYKNVASTVCVYVGKSGLWDSVHRRNIKFSETYLGAQD